MPAPAHPPVTDPAVTDPAVTDPAVTDPPVTDPPVTDPAVTDPAVTDPAVTDPADPLPTTPPVKDAVLPVKPAAPDLSLADAALPGGTLPGAALPGAAPPSQDPAPAVPGVESVSNVPPDCPVIDPAVAAPRNATAAPAIGLLGSALYLPALDRAVVDNAAAPATDPPPAGSLPGGSVPSPGKDHHSPWPNGTGLPAPDALPAAPGSGSGNTLSSGGPASGAAWLPSPYLVIPTAGTDPISGPLQHVHSAVAADPGSSPD
ncbi:MULTISPECIES: hypothetical protein [unclassified Arthrobacter]|uniref:hypothetical protein n=1 Tax=unclassified Arthrobacter TaxID=235627 RepID=UPI002E155216|nr:MULTISPECIES: hypothetical protein [unclassified Arthrobacter]